MKKLIFSNINILFLIKVVFFLSGFVSLIYQIVWQRILTLYYGVGSISTTIIVSVYMLGLGLGSLMGGYLAENVKDKIRLYIYIEIALGCFGIISLSFLDFLGHRTSGAPHFISLGLMFLFLCIPTCLMGITLPLVVKIFNKYVQNFTYSVGTLYFINTLGASLGSIIGSFVIISFWGLDYGVYIAALINFILAFFISSVRSKAVQEQTEIKKINPYRIKIRPIGSIVYLCVFITGFLAIGYEIIWFRVIGILVKSSPYAFPSILSVYLLGIASGSLGMTILLTKYPFVKKDDLYFILQLLIGLFVAIIFIGYYYLTYYTKLSHYTILSFSNQLHPPLITPSFDSINKFFDDLFLLTDIFVWPLIFIFVPTFFMGASFPLITSLALSDVHKEGETVGTVYFCNILGNVFGGIFTGFLLLPFLGTENTLFLYSSIGFCFFLFVKSSNGQLLSFRIKIIFISLLIVINFLLFPQKGDLFILMHNPPPTDNYYLHEGVDSVVMTFENRDNIRTFINGTVHGKRPGIRFYQQAIVAFMHAPKAKKALIIGFGSGNTVETLQKMDSIEKIVIVELSRALIVNQSKIKILRDILEDPRVELIIDDGRRFLNRTDEKFDIITMDPLRTITAYSNNIYSYEFYRKVNQHLKKGGITLIWTDELYVVSKTVVSAFDYVKFYGTTYVASNQPLISNSQLKETLINRFPPGYQKSLNQSYRYVGRNELIQNIPTKYPINTDWRPVCEYYLGLRFINIFE